MKFLIRNLKREDAEKFNYEFSCQGIENTNSKFLTYFSEQKIGRRKVFVAEFQGEVLGYISLIPNSVVGAFKNANIPEIVDFSVLERYQGNHIASTLLNEAECFSSKICDSICIALCPEKNYGKALQIFANRGYIPHNSGLWYSDCNLSKFDKTVVDENLVLYFKKELKKIIR